MRINNKDFSVWSYQDLEALKSDDYCESNTLDYKLEFSRNDDFKNDVCAFANSQGGYLIYGVREKVEIINNKKINTGKADDIVGIPNLGEDEYSRQIGNSLSDSIEPSRPQYRIKVVDLADITKCVLVVHILEGYEKPYRAKQTKRFYLRGNTGNEEMSYMTVREMFLKTEAIEQRAYNFIDSRIEFLHHQRNPKYIRYNQLPSLHFYLLPTSVLYASSKRYDLSNEHPFVLVASGSDEQPWKSLVSYQVNIDGLMIKPSMPDADDKLSHIQIFRNGIIEFVTTEFTYESVLLNIQKYVFRCLEECLRLSISFYNMLHVNANDQMLFCAALENADKVEVRQYGSGMLEKIFTDRCSQRTLPVVINGSDKEAIELSLSVIQDEVGYMLGENNYSQRRPHKL